MFAPDRFLAFLLIVLVLIVVPGPSVLFVVSRGIALGRRAAVATVVGNTAGIAVQAVTVAVGLGAVVAASATVFSIIKVVGAVYLVYLGIQAWRHRRALAAAAGAAGEHRTQRRRRVIWQGFLVGATNPKGLLIFTAVLPQFIDPARADPTLQLLVLAAVAVGIALVTDTIWGLLAGTARVWLGRSARRLELMGGVAGATMVGLGVHLALSSHRTTA